MDTINHNSLLSTRFISFPGFMDTQPNKRRDVFRFGFRVFLFMTATIHPHYQAGLNRLSHA